MNQAPKRPASQATPNPAGTNIAGSTDSTAFVKTRCPHCQTINQVKKDAGEEVFKCTNCEQMFRLRAKVEPTTQFDTATVARFPVRCKCGVVMSVTSANFGKQVKCKSCNQVIRIPNWIAEKKYTADEFDDLFSPDEKDAFQQRMANSQIHFGPKGQ
ncbi:hypothetical protein SAMN06265222_12342 [Neorhodopirellula lusitana]|uniref:Uncharacterized protein n=1 Tax=Neorhodopirellula lusitana TaxID=445327 RepID=A0ABY1QQE2_9BACT|nr:hypothetical protein [Neorhodopirellula lusitana]SMP77461.1 hypothetical protein SAMN06265222_12342 [Neorhodopirellula lusitana]